MTAAAKGADIDVAAVRLAIRDACCAVAHATLRNNARDPQAVALLLCRAMHALHVLEAGLPVDRPAAGARRYAETDE